MSRDYWSEGCLLPALGPSTFAHGLGRATGSRTIVRNLHIDLSKVLAVPVGKKVLSASLNVQK